MRSPYLCDRNRPVVGSQARRETRYARFQLPGKPVTQLSTKAWYAALKRAGISDFRWHDLRHTWASWHAQGGTPLFAPQELGGWESAEMVRRYAHLAADHLAPYTERLCALRVVEDQSHGTNTAQA